MIALIVRDGKCCKLVCLWKRRSATNTYSCVTVINKKYICFMEAMAIGCKRVHYKWIRKCKSLHAETQTMRQPTRPIQTRTTNTGCHCRCCCSGGSNFYVITGVLPTQPPASVKFHQVKELCWFAVYMFFCENKNKKCRPKAGRWATKVMMILSLFGLWRIAVFLFLNKKKTNWNTGHDRKRETHTSIVKNNEVNGGYPSVKCKFEWTLRVEHVARGSTIET